MQTDAEKWREGFHVSAQQFEMTARHTRTIAEVLLTEHFGERCPDFEPDCECCKRWKLLDELLNSPYSD